MTEFEKANIDLIDRSILEKIKNAKYPKCGLYLFGNVGVGKTFTAISIAKYISKNNYKFMLIQDIFREFRKCESAMKEEILIKELVFKRHLIVDDLGIEKLTDWSYSIFEEFISKRNMLYPEAIIFTSNLSIPELANKLDPRIASKILGFCVEIKINGNDRRLVKFK